MPWKCIKLNTNFYNKCKKKNILLIFLLNLSFINRASNSKWLVYFSSKKKYSEAKVLNNLKNTNNLLCLTLSDNKILNDLPVIHSWGTSLPHHSPIIFFIITETTTVVTTPHSSASSPPTIYWSTPAPAHAICRGTSGTTTCYPVTVYSPLP